MDPISRESSPSYLPIAGLIAGLVGLLLGAIALANASKASKAAATASEQTSALTTKVEGVESTLATASANADTALRNLSSLKNSTQEGFNTVATELGKTNGEIAKLQEAATKAAKPVKAADGKSAGPAVAGPDEYVVVAGDTGAKIARAKGVGLADLVSVNPGVNWSALKVGQKVKLPKK
ncbi:MAG: LysM peptidoglycan-binding domain-containing protein [Verrucomicrobia bacterium]|nr:LysM peptidoglycan-binding domain-containing protein [Verrucomicrobiota bacterium]